MPFWELTKLPVAWASDGPGPGPGPGFINLHFSTKTSPHHTYKHKDKHQHTLRYTQTLSRLLKCHFRVGELGTGRGWFINCQHLCSINGHKSVDRLVGGIKMRSDTAKTRDREQQKHGEQEVPQKAAQLGHTNATNEKYATAQARISVCCRIIFHGM